MADVVDDDTLAAVEGAWTGSTVLSGLVSRAPQTGRLKSVKDQPQTLPYVQLACAFSKVERFYGGRFDVRKVTVTIRGLKADVVKVLAAAQDVFNSQMGNPAGNVSPLVYPSKARFVKWWPTIEGKLAQEETTLQGQDVWMGVIEGEATSVRT